MVTIRSSLFLSSMAITLLTVVVPAAGQLSDDDAKDIAFICASPALAENDSAKQKEPLLSDSDVSDATILSHFLIRVYQKYISSQQHNVCVFTPSCSHFGMESVQRFGFAGGFLMTADRLTRCNSFVSQGGYAFDLAAGKFADPVAAYCQDSAGIVSCKGKIP